MTPEALRYVYIHANSLAELGLFSAMRDVEARMPEPLDELAELSEEERDALVAAQLEKLYLSSNMDDFVWETPEHDAAVLAGLAELQAQDAAGYCQADTVCAAPPAADGVPQFGEISNYQHDDADGDELDLGVYLAKAYAAFAGCTAHCDELLPKLDVAKLEELLAVLPGDLPPLTGALTADDLQQWLDLYMEDRTTLGELVTMIRALQPVMF